jgi:hypothetical protein
MLHKICVRAPFLGSIGVSERNTKFGVFISRKMTISTREGLVRPAFRTLRVKKESCSMDSAP